MGEKVNQLASAQWLDAAREMVVSYSLKIIGVIVLLLLANLVAGWIGRLAARAMKSRVVDS